ncbi:(d)CMP kinase [Ascidiimonas sp. W6]|uniref:(d)CMP kinase n=1 Tax=Ascidiimonas meishanensis TaxID=3128903 RepID=UPI0030EE4C57
MNQKITIAIDGFSSTGKSTIAKRLAKELEYVYVDTGAMYRAITLFALENGYISKDHENREALVAELSNINLEFKFNSNLNYSEMYLNGRNVEKEIRTMQVSSFVSSIATIPEVRSKLVEMQKSMGEKKGIVMDGRDIGTVVFPDAELKLFLTASAQKRAQRRYDELLERGENVTYDEVLKNVTSRDEIDSTRKTSPLKKAKDAIEVDNSSMGLEEQFKQIHQHVLQAIQNS